MIKNLPQTPKHLQSPRRLLNHRQLKPQSHVQQQYQLKAQKSVKKKQNSAFKRTSHLNSSPCDRSSSKRRLSIKRNSPSIIKEGESSKLIRMNDNHLANSSKSNTQLALQIQYNQFRNNTKKDLNQKHPIQVETAKRRIRRIRSSSSLSRSSLTSTEQLLGQKLAFAKQENTRLKGLKIQTLSKLSGLEQNFAIEHSQFEAEIISFQRQICALKNKIERNKNQFGHLFTYQSYDPVKLFTKPIVEVEGENSHFQSLLKHSSVQELNNQSRMRENNVQNIDKKEQLTETTGAASRQEYGQIQSF